MKLDVKFNSSELAEKLKSGIYDIPENSTIAEFIDTVKLEAELEISNELKESLVFLYDNRHASWDTQLSDGGKLRVLHKVLGG